MNATAILNPNFRHGDTRIITNMTAKIHTIILDAGPLIKGEPSISTLLQQSDELVTTPAVISEIRDAHTRLRLETTVVPFLKLRTPKAESIKFVSDFARKTGDAAVLSRTDLQLLALAYEVECEQNGGYWRLRREPGQKGMNGSPPTKSLENEEHDVDASNLGPSQEASESTSEHPDGPESMTKEATAGKEESQSIQATAETQPIESIAEIIECLDISTTQEHQADEVSDDSDSEGWITPSNIKKKQLEDTNANASDAPVPKAMQVVSLPLA